MSTITVFNFIFFYRQSWTLISGQTYFSPSPNINVDECAGRVADFNIDDGGGGGGGRGKGKGSDGRNIKINFCPDNQCPRL